MANETWGGSASSTVRQVPIDQHVQPRLFSWLPRVLAPRFEDLNRLSKAF